jgi:hypothetical protein
LGVEGRDLPHGIFFRGRALDRISEPYRTQFGFGRESQVKVCLLIHKTFVD